MNIIARNLITIGQTPDTLEQELGIMTVLVQDAQGLVAAYHGITKATGHNAIEAQEWIARHGAKLTEAEARLRFPSFGGTYELSSNGEEDKFTENQYRA